MKHKTTELTPAQAAMHGIRGDTMAVLRLAMNRYPKDEPLMALEFYRSDRRAAGLGALAVERTGNRWRRQVWNRKRFDLLSGRVHYGCMVDIPEGWAYPEADLDLSPLAGVFAETVTLVKVPARHVERALQVDRRELETFSGRRKVAAQLRGLRREMRAA